MANRFFLFLGLFLYWSCTFNPHPDIETPQSNNSNLIEDTILVIKNTEESIKSISYNTLKSEKRQILGKEKLNITCWFDSVSNFPRVLKIETLDNESRIIFAEEFYFDNNSNPQIYSYPIDETEVSCTIFTPNRDVISYVKKDGRINVNSLDSFTKETKISAIMFKLASYIHFFSTISYNGFQPSLKSLPVLKTSKAIPILDIASCQGKEVGKLAKNEHLFYLGCSIKQDSCYGSKWVWYKVARKNKKITGWVFGHPNFVEELTDENLSD